MGGYNWRHLRTGREDSIPSAILPANDLPHFLQSDVFQQHEHWSHLVGEPGLHKRDHMTELHKICNGRQMIEHLSFLPSGGSQPIWLEKQFIMGSGLT